MRVRPLSLRDIAARRAAAARDADLLASGWTPDAATLADAPFLDQYYEATWPGTDLPVMCGKVTGHPRLLPGRCMTTPILARGENWIRTEGRFYRLGTPRAVPPPSAIEELAEAWAGYDVEAIEKAILEALRAEPSKPAPKGTRDPDDPDGPIYLDNGYVGW